VDEVEKAREILDEICETIEDEISDRIKDEHAQYFEDVEEKAKSIFSTIEKTERVSGAQMSALENMLAGVKKWVRD
jgi:hypothetical protein